MDLQREKGELQRRLNRTKRELDKERAKPKGVKAKPDRREDIVGDSVSQLHAEPGSDSDSSDPGDWDNRTLVSLDMLRECQGEVVALQVNLVQTQEQLQRSLMEMDRSIAAFEHQETKATHLGGEKMELKRRNALLSTQLVELEKMYKKSVEDGMRVLQDAKDGVKPIDYRKSEDEHREEEMLKAAEEKMRELEIRELAAQESTEIAARAERDASEFRKKAEEATVSATTDEEKAAASLLMSQSSEMEKDLIAMKSDAEHETRLVAEGMESEQSFVLERAKAAAADKKKREALEELERHRQAYEEAKESGLYSYEEIDSMKEELVTKQDDADLAAHSQFKLHQELA